MSIVSRRINIEDTTQHGTHPPTPETLIDELDTFNTDQIICPFCGAVIDDGDYDMSDTGRDTTAECGDCGRTCTIAVEYSVSYTTRRPHSKTKASGE